MYKKGDGIPQDYAEAMKWFLLAATQGDRDAQYNIGQMYYYEEGVTKNIVEACKWWIMAGHQNNEYAWINIKIARREMTSEQSFAVDKFGMEREMHAIQLGDYIQVVHNDMGGFSTV